MLQIAIVEDNPADADQLSSCLEEWHRAHPEVEIVSSRYPNAVPFMDKANRADLVFMDIEMPYMNGIDAAEKFRQINNDAILIFVTRATQYAVRGYSVDAMSYLVKPIQKETFFRTMDKALRIYKEKTANHFVMIKTADGMLRLNTGTIRYLDVFGHSLEIHEEKKVYKVWAKIGAIGEKLPANFVPCHRSYIVNLKYVDCVLKDGLRLVGDAETFIPISRNKREDFLSALTRYYTEAMGE
jgi:two-component system, LytTR family, response regulator LytT